MSKSTFKNNFFVKISGTVFLVYLLDTLLLFHSFGEISFLTYIIGTSNNLFNFFVIFIVLISILYIEILCSIHFWNNSRYNYFNKCIFILYSFLLHIPFFVYYIVVNYTYTQKKLHPK